MHKSLKEDKAKRRGIWFFYPENNRGGGRKRERGAGEGEQGRVRERRMGRESREWCQKMLTVQKSTLPTFEREISLWDPIGLTRSECKWEMQFFLSQRTWPRSFVLMVNMHFLLCLLFPLANVECITPSGSLALHLSFLSMSRILGGSEGSCLSPSEFSTRRRLQLPGLGKGNLLLFRALPLLMTKLVGLL